MTVKKGGLNLGGCGEGEERTRHGCSVGWNLNPFGNPIGCCIATKTKSIFGGGRRKNRKRKKTRRKRKQQKKYTRQRGGLVTRSIYHTTRRSVTTVAGGRKKKFRKGSKSKTHRGKNFETRKTSKNYNSKLWKRMTGRRTIRAPLFPFV